MGFTAVESRELDDDYHMFSSLNFPEGHPARDDYDTFVTTQTDLQVAGQDREAATAFYAAEAGVAFAKDWLATQNLAQGAGAFSAILQSGAIHHFLLRAPHRARYR